MAYYLGRDVSVTIGSGVHVEVTTAGALAFSASTGVDFASTTPTTVTDLTSLDLGIGVTDEDITYIGSRTVLKAEIKKETTISLTRKKKIYFLNWSESPKIPNLSKWRIKFGIWKKIPLSKSI